MPRSEIHSQPAAFGRMYFIGWTVAAAVALVYLATLAVRPDLIAAHGIGRPHDLESNEGARFLARGRLDATPAMASGQILTEIEAVKASLRASEQREQALLARVAAIEARTGDGGQGALGVRVSAAEAASAPGGAAPGLIEGRVVDPQPAALPPEAAVAPTAALPPPPPRNPRPVAAVAAPTALPGTVVASTEPPRSYGIALASGPSLEALRLTWSLLSERHKAALQDLDPRYTIQSEQTAPFQLVAGPFPSAARAQQVCAVLQARKAACKVSEFGGNAL